MEILLIIVMLSGGIYCLINLLIHLGLNRQWPRTTDQPAVTVLVAARNEAENLPACLEHLAAQHYPGDKLQILILNDRSTDTTGDIARSFAARFDFIELIDIDHDKTGLMGKMNVIAQGMSYARGDIILITDADCEPSPAWISEMTSFFTEETAMVGGLTLLTGKGIFGKIQSADWLFLQAVAAGVAGIGVPVSILGNNFGYRKQVYNEIGGFEHTGFSLTEDLTLLQAVRRKKKLKVAYPLSTRSLVVSKPVHSIPALIHQRLRWLAGGRQSGPFGWIMLGATFILHLLLPAALLLMPWNTLFWFMTVIIVMLDLGLLFRLVTRLRSWQFVVLFPLFEVYYFVYTTIFGFLSVLPFKINWKDRIYRPK